jgi:hypothetical protein
MEMRYRINKAYYCSDCGLFYSRSSHLLVEVPYTEMPAEFALKVMEDRQKTFKPCYPKYKVHKLSEEEMDDFDDR